MSKLKTKIGIVGNGYVGTMRFLYMIQRIIYQTLKMTLISVI
jgi:hypothetical protein